MPWPRQPVIYEINTWIWIGELRKKYERGIHLGNVPASEWDAIADLNLDGVWLMGVWERSPAGQNISATKPELVGEYKRELPDFTDADVVGSPYCVHEYKVDAYLGGPAGLAAARAQLRSRGLALLLDFVPNHVAPDHAWTVTHPEYFIRGNEEDCRRAPDEFFRAGTAIIANGRDPYFAPWSDTAQLNAFNPGLRQAALQTVNSISSQCDGVRCDMAMLLMNRIFAQTWGGRAGSIPVTDYWVDLIATIRKKYPAFLFVAEAYWDLESELIAQGFDYCYDKRLYDRLVHENADSIHAHLVADVTYQEHMVRFLENHDEPRAAAVFSPARERAAAVALMTLPGAKLLHEGQLEGRKVHVAVQLGRRPDEAVNAELRQFYRKLLDLVKETSLRAGNWILCSVCGWSDNQSCSNLLAWRWNVSGQGHVVVVNFCDQTSQGRVQLPLSELRDRQWELQDLLSGTIFSHRDGNEMFEQGLFVDLPAWGAHWFRLQGM
ncbi:MAG TPA: alpha-amylase family glycosyl hydrolase [Terriglobales bacterium]|nr:alpha-amylase family glycosyl hydrolase [Terriglobales bacterium]